MMHYVWLLCQLTAISANRIIIIGVIYMKLYVKSDIEPMQIVNVVLDFSIESDDYYEEPVAASLIVCGDDIQLVDSNGEMLINEGGQIIDDVYESLLDTIEVTADSMGLLLLHDGQSDFSLDGNRSHSRYMDFCVKDKHDSQTVRFIFFIRISDHKDTHKNHKRHAKRRLKMYMESGISDGEIIMPELRRITIGRQSYPTISAAMRKIREIFNELKASESQ